MKKHSTDSAGIEQIKWSPYRRHVCFLQSFCARWIALARANAKTVFGHLNIDGELRISVLWLYLILRRFCGCFVETWSLTFGGFATLKQARGPRRTSRPTAQRSTLRPEAQGPYFWSAVYISACPVVDPVGNARLIPVSFDGRLDSYLNRFNPSQFI